MINPCPFWFKAKKSFMSIVLLQAWTSLAAVPMKSTRLLLQRMSSLVCCQRRRRTSAARTWWPSWPSHAQNDWPTVFVHRHCKQGGDVANRCAATRRFPHW